MNSLSNNVYRKSNQKEVKCLEYRECRSSDKQTKQAAKVSSEILELELFSSHQRKVFAVSKLELKLGLIHKQLIMPTLVVACFNFEVVGDRVASWQTFTNAVSFIEMIEVLEVDVVEWSRARHSCDVTESHRFIADEKERNTTACFVDCKILQFNWSFQIIVRLTNERQAFQLAVPLSVHVEVS
jgi:hypothetical protein